MPDYRLYCLNNHGRIVKAHDVEARNDEEAIAAAKDMQLPSKCELWDKDRLVAEIEAYG